MYVCVAWLHVCYDTRMEDKRQTTGTSSLPPPYRFQVSNPSCQVRASLYPLGHLVSPNLATSNASLFVDTLHLPFCVWKLRRTKASIADSTDDHVQSWTSPWGELVQHLQSGEPPKMGISSDRFYFEETSDPLVEMVQEQRESQVRGSSSSHASVPRS